MTGEQIAPDEKVLPELAFDFDGKRDRWNGYDPREHKRVVQEHLKLEEAKRVLKAQQMNESLVRCSSIGFLLDDIPFFYFFAFLLFCFNSVMVVPSQIQMKGELPEKEKKKVEDSDSEDDEDKYADEMDMPGTKVSVTVPDTHWDFGLLLDAIERFLVLRL